MRILHLGKYYPPVAGGIENFTRLAAEAVVARGHAVVVLAHSAGRDSPARSATSTTPRVVTTRTFGELVHAPVAPFFLFDLWRLLRAEKPDLLHVHLPNLSAFWLFLCPPAWRRPWLLHWHADVVFTPDRRLARWLYRLAYRPLEWLLLRLSARVLVTSPPYLESSRALRSFHDKCRVVPLTVEAVAPSGPASQPGQSQSAWSGQGMRVLMVGRLTPYKGHRVLLDALQELQSNHDRVAQVMIVGSGPEEARIRAGIAERGLSDSARLETGIDDNQLLELYQSCDLVCLPSLDRGEAFGIVLLEAMRQGKPVLASALAGSGVSWVVEEGVTGWQFPTGDAGALAERLRYSADHPDELRRAGRAASQRLEERFGVTIVIEELIGHYEELCESLD